MFAVQTVSFSNFVSLEGSEWWQRGHSACYSWLGLSSVKICMFGSVDTSKEYFMCPQKITVTKFCSYSYLIRTFLKPLRPQGGIEGP